MINPFLTKHLPAVGETCRTNHVRRLYVFGSVCTERFNNDSDIDFLVDFGDLQVVEYGDAYFALLDSLKQILGRKVDLLTESSLSNPYFAESVEESKVLVYGT